MPHPMATRTIWPVVVWSGAHCIMAYGFDTARKCDLNFLRYSDPPFHVYIYGASLGEAGSYRLQSRDARTAARVRSGVRKAVHGAHRGGRRRRTAHMVQRLERRHGELTDLLPTHS